MTRTGFVWASNTLDFYDGSVPVAPSIGVSSVRDEGMVCVGGSTKLERSLRREEKDVGEIVRLTINGVYGSFPIRKPEDFHP